MRETNGSRRFQMVEQGSIPATSTMRTAWPAGPLPEESSRPPASCVEAGQRFSVLPGSLHEMFADVDFLVASLRTVLTASTRRSWPASYPAVGGTFT